MEDINENNSKRTLSSSYIISRLLGYMKGSVHLFIIALILYVLQAFSAALEPMIEGRVINLINVSDFGTATKYGWFFCAIITANYCVFAFIGGYLIQKGSQDIIYRLRNDVFDHIQNLSINQLHSVPVGKWVTRTTSDVNSIMDFFSNVLIQLIYNFLFLIALMVFVFVASWKLAFIDLAFLPVIAVVFVFFTYFSRKSYREVRAQISNMNAFLSENLSGMETIQIFNQETRKKREFTAINKKLAGAHWGAVRIFATFRPSIYLLYIGSLLCVFGFGLPMLARGELDVGTLYSFYSYTGYLFQPVQNIANQFNAIQSALAGAERVVKVLDTKSEIADEPDAMDIGHLQGKIEFRHVWFAYKGDEWILKDVSFVINPGDTVAFVGETGAGKSTIINLMCRNFDIQKGEILLDDIPIKKIKLASLRRNIGEMLQDVFLFSGDISYNISLGDPNISEEKVEKSAEFVGASDFIERLPDGYHHIVNENGNNFSQGQRQLISFARAVAYEPSVMVLDEATANIDTETEVIIQNSLEKMKSIGTMVMVAHRLSTIKHASMIYVVDHGVIAEQGDHQTLLKKRGIYYNLYKLQNMEDEMQANGVMIPATEKKTA